MGQPKGLWNFIRRTYSAFPLWVWLCASGMAGSIVGIGLYTFVYAGGHSYLSNDPKVCVNCHIMRDVYEGWNHSSHKSVATCNDCHTPHNYPAKLVSKGINGWNHSVAFTTGKFHEPIQIKKFNRDILQQNCLHCHGNLTDPILHKNSDEPLDCLRCHSRVGHGW